MDAVEDGQTMGTRGEQRQTERCDQRQTIPGGESMQILGQV